MRRDRITIVEGDITRFAGDAIVNAANSSLLGGGGVDGAIHRAGGSAILDECRLLGGCKTGEAKATTGGLLGARHVIHTVGPVWRGGQNGEPALLADCHRNALRVAAGLGCATIAFPAISTGAFGYPVPDAATAAIGSARSILPELDSIELVTFVLFDRFVYGCFEEALVRSRQQ